MEGVLDTPPTVVETSAEHRPDSIETTLTNCPADNETPENDHELEAAVVVACSTSSKYQVTEAPVVALPASVVVAVVTLPLKVGAVEVAAPPAQ